MCVISHLHESNTMQTEQLLRFIDNTTTVNGFGSNWELKVCNKPQYLESNRAAVEPNKEKSIVVVYFCGNFFRVGEIIKSKV